MPQPIQATAHVEDCIKSNLHFTQHNKHNKHIACVLAYGENTCIAVSAHVLHVPSPRGPFVLISSEIYVVDTWELGALKPCEGPGGSVTWRHVARCSRAVSERGARWRASEDQRGVECSAIPGHGFISLGGLPHSALLCGMLHPLLTARHLHGDTNKPILVYFGHHLDILCPPRVRRS